MATSGYSSGKGRSIHRSNELAMFDADRNRGSGLCVFDACGTPRLVRPENVGYELKRNTYVNALFAFHASHSFRRFRVMLPNPPAYNQTLSHSQAVPHVRFGLWFASLRQSLPFMRGLCWLPRCSAFESRGCCPTGPRLINAFPRPRLRLWKPSTCQPAHHGDTKYHF